MDAPTIDFTKFMADNQPLTEEQMNRLAGEVRSGEREKLAFAKLLDDAVSSRESEFSGDQGWSLKVGQGYCVLGKYNKALEWLGKAGSGLSQCLAKAYCQRETGNYEAAVKTFEEAESKGYESFEATMAVVDCLRRAGELEQAGERLNRVSRVGDIRAEYRFQLGMLNEANGLHDDAVTELARAVELDNNHSRALFQLAFLLDLHGNEEDAIKCYERCVSKAPASLNALLNLAVLYEDSEQWDKAGKCIKRVLATHPNHLRARLFLKDVEASRTMYYDEEQERRVDLQNQVLEIPISDFELSVRSRNCLKKMGVRSLGDLLKVGEAELLAYKNFGETSLTEIKQMLHTKGLQLGQLTDDRNNNRRAVVVDEEEEEEEQEWLGYSVAELNLSVRARKCLQRLNLNTLGDLTSCTEAELLGCKNFGMTSLIEVKEKLQEQNLSLRELDEE